MRFVDLSAALALFLAACGGAATDTPLDDAAIADDGGGADADLGDAPAPELCGGETCRSDQSCVGDVCTFACTGATVPGDYATVEAAADALRSVDGAVICLRGESYPAPSLILGTDLTIIGVSASATTLTGPSTIATRGHVTYEGITFDSKLELDGLGGETTLVGAKVTGGIELHRTKLSQAAAGHRGVLDGVEVVGGVWLRDFACDQCTGKIELDMRNSYVHGGDACLRWDESGDRTAFVVHAVNNTLVGCMRGIYAPTQIDPAGSPIHDILLENNIVANHSIAGISHEAFGSMNSQTTFVTGNNALWGNTSNYEGGAIDGPGYVKQDCAISGAPPSPGAGSPCLGAGDATVAPDHDYFGHVRTAPVDIGAVEVP